MSTISIYVDGIRHDISAQNTAYDINSISEALNTYFASNNIPLEAYLHMTPTPPNPPWGGTGPDIGLGQVDVEWGSSNDSIGYASFSLKRIPSDQPAVSNAAIYERNIPNQQAWGFDVDVNSILMGHRYIDFNNSRNDRTNPQNTPEDWLIVGEFQTDYGITSIDLSNLTPTSGTMTAPISVDKSKPYDYDPRIALQVIKITSDREMAVEVNAIDGSGDMRFKSFSGNEWGSGMVLLGPVDADYSQAGQSNWGGVGSKEGTIPVRPNQATWLLVTDAIIGGEFLSPSRNSNFDLTFTRNTVFRRSTKITATVDPDTLRCVIALTSWGGGYREMFGSYKYNSFWVFVPKHIQERTYSFVYEESRVDINSLYYFFSDFNDAMSNDDSGLTLTKAESVLDTNYYGTYRAQITIPANKSMMLFIVGKGYSYPIYGEIVP